MFDFKLLAAVLALTVLVATDPAVGSRAEKPSDETTRAVLPTPTPRLLIRRDECSPPPEPGLTC